MQGWLEEEVVVVREVYPTPGFCTDIQAHVWELLWNSSIFIPVSIFKLKNCCLTAYEL
jgi:hypothetical protein